MAIITIAGIVSKTPELLTYTQPDGTEKNWCRLEVREGYGSSMNYFDIAVFGDRLVPIALHTAQNDPVKVECDLTTKIVDKGGTKQKVLNLTAKQVQCLDFEAFNRRWGISHDDPQRPKERMIPKAKASDQTNQTESSQNQGSNSQNQPKARPQAPKEMDFSKLLDMEEPVQNNTIGIDEIDQFDW